MFPVPVSFLRVPPLPPLAGEPVWLESSTVAVVQTPTPGASLPGIGKKGVVGRTHSPVVVAAVAAELECRSSVTEWELKNAKMVLDSLKNELIKTLKWF